MVEDLSRNVIIIMTTNAGAQIASRRSMGFTEQQNELDAMEEINRMFTPEFRNRLDSIVQFGPLDEKTIASVVDKFLVELEAQLDEALAAVRGVHQPESVV